MIYHTFKKNNSFNTQENKTIIEEISQLLFKIHSKLITTKNKKITMELICDLSCTIASILDNNSKIICANSI